MATNNENEILKSSRLDELNANLKDLEEELNKYEQKKNNETKGSFKWNNLNELIRVFNYRIDNMRIRINAEKDYLRRQAEIDKMISNQREYFKIIQKSK